MVTTSLKMPQMLSVTTDVRCNRANSEAVIQKASTPGNNNITTPKAVPLISVRVWKPAFSGPKPSIGIASNARLRNMIGARKKILLNGLLVAGFRRSKIWVKAQRKPEKKADEMMRMKPRMLKAVSPATIIMTPIVMVAMIRMSFIEGVSRRKINAKRRTKAKAEDLHIARCI